jgi:ABC-type Fe3+/spermidine/putrescine transport system ATPase subunit
VVMRSEQIMVLSEGKITEIGSPIELACTPGSQFAALFPYFTQTCLGMTTRQPFVPAQANPASSSNAQENRLS